MSVLSEKDQRGPAAHKWATTRIKLISNKIGSGKTPRGGNEVYSDSGVIFLRSQNVYDDGLRLDDVVYIDDTIDEEMSRTRVRPNDVLLNITGASIGRTCIVPSDFSRANVNQHVCIIRLRRKVLPHFIAYALKSLQAKDQIRSFENGSSREGLNFEQVGNLVVQLPDTLDQQQAIADFLDRQTAEIDGLIAKKQRLIDLLGEKRQALISHAVTKGLNPDAPMKDSGIEWLGEVPEHWKVERLKFCVKGIAQGWSPQCENRQAEPGEWGVLKVGCMNSGVYDEAENKALPPELTPLPELEVRIGDVLMSRSNTVELVGAVGRVHATQGKILLCDKLYRLNIRATLLDPEFAVHLLRSHSARLQIQRDASGASPSMKNISIERVANLLFAFPPIAEQKTILKRLRREIDEGSRIVRKITTQIAKLREYRQTLISAAVTGKRDVKDMGVVAQVQGSLDD